MPEDDLNLTDGSFSIEEQTSIEELDMPERNDEGYYIVDDMYLDESQYRANFGTDEERQVIPDASYRWPNGVVPYYMTSTVPYDRKQKIRDALDVLNKALVNCVKFQ